VDQSWDRAVLSERRVVGSTEGKIPNETNDGLNQRPARRRMHEADDGWETALKSDCVLRNLAFCMA
jgi:hypothetical protein